MAQINKAVFLAPGNNPEDQKALLGIWLVENESVKFWLSVLKNGVFECNKQNLFADAYPVIHLRNKYRRKTIKPLPACRRTEETGVMARCSPGTGTEEYPQISKSWRTSKGKFQHLFGYPLDIRKAIYTTDTIELLNSVIRAAIKKRFKNYE